MRAPLAVLLAATLAVAQEAGTPSLQEALRAGEAVAVTPGMLPALLEAADGDDEALCRAAVDAIRRLGPEAMSRYLEEDPSAYMAVYRGLAHCGPEGQRALVAWLPRHHWPDQAVLALAECDGSVVVPLLLGKTKDADSFVRTYALQALAYFRVDEEPLAEALRRCLADPAARVRRAALLWARPFLEEHRDASFLTLLRERLWEEDSEICGFAAAALGALGSAAAPAAADLAGIAKQGPARQEALDALQEIGPAAAPGARYALTQMLEDPPWSLSAACALATVAPDERKAVAVLVDALEEKDDWGLMADIATRALVAMGTAAAPELPRLRRMREGEDPVLRVRAATVAMSASGHPEEGLPTLLDFLEGDATGEAPGADTVLEAIVSLKEKARPAVPRLRRLLAKADPYLRVCLAQALWEITGDSREVLPALRDLLSPGGDEFTILSALEIVEQMGPAAADLLPRLRELAESESEIVRAMAEPAIRAVGEG